MKCMSCGEEFEYPATVRDYRGEYWGAPCWENIGVCPHCGGDDIDYDYYEFDDEEEEDDYGEEDEEITEKRSA